MIGYLKVLWSKPRLWRYVAVGALAFALGGTTSALATTTGLTQIIGNGIVAYVDPNHNLLVNDTAANAALVTANGHLSNIDSATTGTNSALSAANTTLTSINNRLSSPVSVAGHGRLITLQTTDLTLSTAMSRTAKEWFVSTVDDCRSWTVYMDASGPLNVQFSPGFFANLPGTEIGGSDSVATDGNHFSGWIALQSGVPVAAPNTGVIVQLPAGVSSVTIHSLYFYCSV